MNGEHHYSLQTEWTGNLGEGTSGYRSYTRDHLIHIQGKPVISGSSDPAFRGDPARHNPEELLLAALSSCHMLAYLHLCAVAGVIVTGYTDEAKGTMVELPGGSGRFTEVTLHPTVIIKDAGMQEKANELHHKAHELCFIANSVNFPVITQPIAKTATT